MVGMQAQSAVEASQPAPAAAKTMLVFVVSLFFIWGGVTSLNDILIPKLKTLFQLNFAQAMLTQFAFFTAYAFVSLPAGWAVSRLGYGKGIVLGLSTMAAGCALFAPAAALAQYGVFLAALFVLASGVTILQVAANPLIANLGPAHTSHSRLTFAQAFNSLGTTIWPYIGAQVILSEIAADPSAMSGAELAAFQAKEAAVLSGAYIAIAAVLVALALLFWMWRAKLGGGSVAGVSRNWLGALRRPRLAFGVAAIFFYVGAEVSIGSMLVNYLSQASTLGLSERGAGEYVAFYWGGAMVGRFIGAYVLRLVSPGITLCGASIGAMALALLSAFTAGPFAGWAVLAIGLMNAIMFPTIFSLALEGLGDETPQGSGLLCMAIVGGAIVPLIFGALADASSLAFALVVPAACYAIVASFGAFARKPAAA